MLAIVIQGMAQAQKNVIADFDMQTGTVSHIHDGDTFRLNQPDGSFIRVRLANIDAPEVQPPQPYGKQAQRYLDSAIDKQTVQIKVINRDQYGRTVALLYHNGQQINRLLVANGYAWHYLKYSTDTTLTGLEKQAREKHLGLWHDPNPIEPWQFRKEKRGK